MPQCTFSNNSKNGLFLLSASTKFLESSESLGVLFKEEALEPKGSLKSQEMARLIDTSRHLEI